ncbi:MAG: hypothetical protein ABL894_15035 [Hyphomicrobium sp.]
MALLQEISQYLIAHPIVLGSIGVFVLLAAVGAWYVLSHHLGNLVTTLLCAAGFASGVLVLYRGYTASMRDLMAVGAFLMLIFPIIYQQGIKVAQIAFGDATSKGHAKRAGI